jgi:hypothetical protein
MIQGLIVVPVTPGVRLTTTGPGEEAAEPEEIAVAKRDLGWRR